MNVKELKEVGITRTKKDNGYGVPTTYQYSREGAKTVIEVDKDDVYGIKCYVASVNDRLLTNFIGKTLYWETLDDAQEDVHNMLLGDMPKLAYTMSI